MYVVVIVEIKFSCLKRLLTLSVVIKTIGNKIIGVINTTSVLQ